MRGQWWHDFRHGLRLLGRSRGFAVAAVASLAIGIGATSAIFSVANGLLLRPLPYPGADRIAIIWQRSPGLGVPQDWLSLGQYFDIASQNTSFERVAAAIGASYNLTGEGSPERVDGVRVSSSFFPLFGARAGLGRVFEAEDDEPGRPPSVVLTHGFWQRRFGGDPDALGRTVTLNGNPVTIVGVMARDFVFDREVMPAVNAVQRVDLLLPLPVPASARGRRFGEDFNVFGALKPGVTVARAQADLDNIAAVMRRDFPTFYPPNGGLTLTVKPLLEQVVGDARLAVYVLLGTVGLVLLIACANVANLLLSRAAVREKEMAIRSALGADRGRLVRQLLAESLTISALGGVLGLGIALLGTWAVRLFAPADIPRMDQIGVDLRVVLFTVAVAVLTGLVFGLAPALPASRVDPQAALKEGGRAGAGLGHGRLRKGLILAEVALSVMLLIGAGLLVRSYQRISAANPGFDPHDVLSFRLSLPFSRYDSAHTVTGFYRDLDARLLALPGVEVVGSNYQLPLSSVSLAWEPISIEGWVPPAGSDGLIISSSGFVSPGYFRAMGMAMTRGRALTAADDREAPPVVIINNRLAERFWPGENPIGKRVRRGADGPWREVVGMVTDAAEYQVHEQPEIAVWFPVEQFTIRSRFVVIRTRPGGGGASALTDAVTREIHALDPELPAYDMATMEQRLGDSLARRRLAMSLLGVFSVIALGLAAIGIYGVIGYWVTQRTREIGLRMALGAGRSDVVRLLAREFAVMVGGGLVVGLAAAFGLTRLMQGLLFGVSPRDTATFLVVPLALGIIAAVATAVPARRAVRVDPVEALRFE